MLIIIVVFSALTITVLSVFRITDMSAVYAVIVIMTALSLCLAGIISNLLTNKIIKKLNDYDFDNDDAFVYDEFSYFIRRVKRKKRKLEKNITLLKNRTDTIEAIAEDMREGVILLDRNGIVLIANKSVSQVFNLNPQEMLRKNILHICRDIEFQQGIKKCFNGESTEMKFERNKRIYNVFFNPSYINDKINGTVVLFFDVTEKYKAEKHRREFSANVSHELKTPLTTISALSEMIENGMAKEEDVKEFAEKISAQAGRLLDIINDIIRLSEFDEGDIKNEHNSFDVYALAETVIAGLMENANDKEVVVELSGDKFDIRANMTMLDELLYNLIDNGIKYNKPQGRVHVTLSKSGEFCVISVTDTGIGIPKEHQKRVFERFYRVDKSRNKKTGGTGLGLSIVKHISEYHHGRVELKSDENSTTITCYIKSNGVY